MATASFWHQLRALLYRNYLLKKRNKKTTFFEFFFPIYFVALLAFIKYISTPKIKPAIDGFGEEYILQSLLLGKKIAIAPDDNHTRAIMKPTCLDITCVHYANTTSMEEAQRVNASLLPIGVIFTSQWNYTIRMPYWEVPRTDFAYLYDTQGGHCRESLLVTCPAHKYIDSGFISLQKKIDDSILKIILGDAYQATPLKTRLMPKSQYRPNTTYIRILSSIYYVMAYSFFVNTLVIHLVMEKEKRIKEGLRMMGMKDSAFWCSWLIIYLIIVTIVTIVVTIIASVSKYLENTNMILFFIILMLYGMSMIAMSFIVSAFFNKASVAGGVAQAVTTILSLLYLVVGLTQTIGPDGLPVSSVAPGGQWAMCLLSPVSLALAIDLMLFQDILRGGASFSTLSEGEFPLFAPILMLFVDFILYSLLAAYLDKVIPNEYGQRHAPYFCFNPSYWFPRKHSVDEQRSLLHVSGYDMDSNVDNTQSIARPDFEPVPVTLHGKKALRIFNISKTFHSKDEDTVAVDGVLLDIYEGQVTALLGHNGAGKTTLINMLTGLMPPTSGTASIYGLDVTDMSDLGEVRAMTGVCPQHDILFDVLTSEEHLYIYGLLKGVSFAKINDEVTRVLNQVNMEDKRSCASNDLSGGQKRKLSVAIAIIGDPKLLILDEPTAGVDAYSRRQLWTLLKAQRHNKVILLTTHYMDEADVLADRKAIISKGKLRCCGSSLYLKNRFGLGYHLGMVIEPEADIGSITDLVVNHISDAKMSRHHGRELTYILPIESVSLFPGLFTNLEAVTEGQSKLQSLKIISYGVSMTTLEEVFMKLGEESEDTLNTILHDHNEVEPKTVRKRNSDNQLESASDLTIQEESTAEGSSTKVEFRVSPLDASTVVASLVEPVNVTKQRFIALSKVRFLQAIRNPRTVVMRVVFPIVLLLLGAIIFKINSKTATISVSYPSALDITTGKYIYRYAMNSPRDSTGKYSPQNAKIASIVYYKTQDGVNLSFIEKGLDRQGLTGAWKQVLTGSNPYSLLVNDRPHHMGISIDDLVFSPVMKKGHFTILYNDTARHSIPSVLNLITNAYLRMGNHNETIGVTSHPWPTKHSGVLAFEQRVFSSVILVGMALLIIPTGFAADTVRDRQTKVRSQLRISGVTLNMYWSTAMLTDLIQYSVASLLAIILVVAFQIDLFVPGGAIFSFFILLLTFMPCSMLFGYVLSFAFKKYDTALALLQLLYIFSALLPFIAVATVDGSGKADTALLIHYVFCVIDPIYPLLGGLYYIARVLRVANVVHGANHSIDFSEYFMWENHIVISWLMPILHCVWMYVLLRGLDVHSTGGRLIDGILPRLFKRKIPLEVNDDHIENEDDDVIQEMHRVEEFQVSSQMPAVLAKNLRKEFSKKSKKKQKLCAKGEMKPVVRNLSLAVDFGEVFGLLGPNGAGKTTTLNMITAETPMTRGMVAVDGHNISSSLSEVFQAMGHCGQHDALWDVITLQEHIELYAAIRGMPMADVKSISNYFIDSLKVTEHQNKRGKQLSGGTKRKLSFAISMLGTPKIVLLDEPSTGMDPQSKRFLWDTISSSFSGPDRSAILTSHYIEEADFLCNRVGIMVNGQLKCIGNTQHLKNKFGSGYILEVKLKDATSQDDLEENIERLQAFVTHLFPTVRQMEQFESRVTYKIPREDVVSLSMAFNQLEKGKATLDIEEYSFSQSTLEQVFIQFAKQQQEEHLLTSRPTSSSVGI